MMERGVDPSGWAWASSGPQREFAAAYAEFRRALAAAYPNEEAANAVREAHTAYIGALQEVWQPGGAAARVREQAAAYAESVRQALSGPDAQNCLDAAFNAYLECLKRAWAASDTERMQPADLAVIAESMAWIASIAAEACRRP